MTVKVGPAIYGIISIGMAVLHLITLVGALTVHQYLGFDGVLKLLGIVNLLGLGLSLRLGEQYRWSK
jgi:hypothetical protein